MLTTTEKPAELAGIDAAKVVKLDVRPTLRAGGEPFSEIMAALGRVEAGGALRLRATFKPAPLFGVLRMRGFQHWVERGEGDDWIVWFYK